MVRKMRTKIIRRILLAVAVLLVLAGALYGYYRIRLDPYRDTAQEFTPVVYELDDQVSRRTAEEDLEYLMKCLRERHPAWLDGSGRDRDVEEQYEKERETLGEQPSLLELYSAASRITARLHDGHTSVSLAYTTEDRFVDDFSIFRNCGDPISINGTASSELLEVYKGLSSYETDAYVEAKFWGNAVVSEHALRMCGVDTKDGVVMTFEQDGREKEHTFAFVPLEQVRGYQQKTDNGEWVFYEIDEARSVGIFTLKTCLYDEEYKAVLDAFFEEVFRRQIQNVVVDLRGNGGGNSLVADEFLRYIDVDTYNTWTSAVRYGSHLVTNSDRLCKNDLKEQTFDGALYVLTDVWTYSSAMDFAMLVQDNGLGCIVGEASGNLPDSYGDCLYFQLPHSGIVLSVSYKRWYRIDQNKAGEQIMPDVPVDAEEALQKVYQLIGQDEA